MNRNRGSAVSIALALCFAYTVPAYAKTANPVDNNINHQIIIAQETIDTVSNIIQDSMDSISFEKAETKKQEFSLSQQPEISYVTTEAYITETVIDVVEPEENTSEVIVNSVEVNEAQMAYITALASYNQALTNYEAADQLTEITREVEVEITEAATDEEGNVVTESRTEVQTITEFVPAGDVEAAKTDLDTASAALEDARLNLETIQSQIVSEEGIIIETDTTEETVLPSNSEKEEYEQSEQLPAEEPASDQESIPTAKRTVLLYLCGSNLETDGGMATFNLHQILNANFSADNNTRFVVMTGGSKTWQSENSYLSDPNGLGLYTDDQGTIRISPIYNQIWEAKGMDADENPGKLVLVDADGILGDGENAKRSEILKSDLQYNPLTETYTFIGNRDDYEWMSDPEVLKAFINYGREHYPAEKYDLILWDHGGGPTGGFAVDENEPGDISGFSCMHFSEMIDALSDNKVIEDNGKFDFIDFDACLMNSVELTLAFAPFADYYIASPESEPGYGQDYSGWLNMLGENPDTDTFTLGKKIVDDFLYFYNEGQGSAQEGTLAVIDNKALMNSDFLAVLEQIDIVLKSQVMDALFYDELAAITHAIQ